MTEPLYSVNFSKILQGNNYTLFILSANGKKFAIYTSPEVGEVVNAYLAEKKNTRPQTHDLISSIFSGLSIAPLQLILQDLNDTVYHCRLFLEQTKGEEQQILDIDTRPSDGLVLALKHNLPIYCTQNVLDKTPEYNG